MKQTLETRAQRTREREAALPPERLRELLSYDPETGLLRWKARRCRVGVGAVAGTQCPDGYVRVMINRKSYLAHRVAWAIHHGRWPVAYLDHIDSRRDNNAIRNLREATAVENRRYRRSRSTASGYRGVYRVGQRFMAKITVDGRPIDLGTYRLVEVAAEVYRQAAREHFGEFARIEDD